MNDENVCLFKYDTINQLGDEDSIHLILDRLNSKNNDVIYETVIQIKNLIIGNNKFKSIYLKDKIIKRLIELINYYNSYSYCQASQNNDESNDTRSTIIINNNSYLLDLTNQLIIIFGSFSLGNLEHVTKLIKLYNLHDILFNLIRLLSKPNTLSSGTSKNLTNQIDKLNLNLIESCLRCLSNLYSSSQLSPYLIYQLDKQLYASSSSNNDNNNDPLLEYPNLESLFKLFNYSSLTKQTILNIITISSVSLCYTSIRFNKNSNKTNIINRLDENLKNFRSILIKSDAIKKFACLLTSLQAKIQLNALKFYASICFENIDASKLILTTNYYDMNLLDLVSAYLSRENGPELQLYAAKCLTNLYRSGLLLNKHQTLSNNSKQNKTKDSVMDSNESSTMDTSSILKQQDQNVEPCLTKQNSTFKLVSQKSQLIKLRTLPTLIRLCCTYSTNYRNANFSNSNSSTKHLNTFLLIESVSTLTYLIELSAELQLTASYLEQIITILASNVLNAFTMGNLTNSSIDSIDSQFFFNSTKISPKSSVLTVENLTLNVCKKQTNLNKLKTTSNTKSIKTAANKIGNRSAKKSKYLCSSPLVAGSSIFSIFYLNYNQFATKGIHLKLNEHQYKTNLISMIAYKAPSLTNHTRYEKLEASIMNKPLKFLRDLDKDLHKRLACVCFHALAALGSNNEEARRIISDNSELLSRIVDSVQIINNETAFTRGILEDITDNENIIRLVRNISDEKLKEEMIEEDEDEEEEEEDDDDDDDDEEDSGDYQNINDVEMGHNEIDHEDLDDEEDNSLDEWDLDEDSIKNKNDASLLRLSSLCLMHSLSRSVQQLRTKFLDNKLWMPLIDLIRRIKSRKQKRIEFKKKKASNRKLKIDCLKSKLIKENDVNQDMVIDSNENSNNENKMHTVSSNDDDLDDANSGYDLFSNGADLEGNLNEQNLITLTLAILANLLLEFSPSKEIMIKEDIIKMLVDFLDYRNISIKVNCMWSLMNLAYQTDFKIKQQILSTITIEKLFQLLTEKDETLIIKTLGLIKNIICYRSHVDQIMSTYGNKIIQALVMVLESEYYNVSIKEQALCILANVADGTTSKEFIMGNEDLLRKINSFMTHNCVELQLAAVSCVSNLVSSGDDGSLERQFKLKEMGFHRILQKLLHSNDPVVFDRVKIALQQFCSSSPSLPSSNLNSSILQQATSNNNSSSSSSSSSSTMA